MSKKFLDLQCDILVLIGIFFAIRFIYTKEIFIQINGYTINTLVMLIHTIVVVGLYRVNRVQIEQMIRKQAKK
ncbi:hypothetical protein [Bacillus sp. V2I10]|jgi:hypothetical protein|uniref:hypothetical protein n=1 Tax=Bacillus sp. V2I10 TaxID=3042276 RepID=UPI002781F568|nr:hypothetical protein [Bacillus sp. V2I10]MDQ0859816.1 hypothetical protein [Bacillus sp. V2I10]